MTRLALLVAVAAATSACSDRSTTPPPGDGRSADRTPIGDRGLSWSEMKPGDLPSPGREARVSDSTVGGPCPAQLPTPNASCSPEGLACDYGDNPLCLSTARCGGGKWVVKMVKCKPPDPACPATREAAAGQGCSTKDGYCLYGGLVCRCTNCKEYPVPVCSGPLTWHCDAPNTTPGCPAARPNLGTPCAKEGQFCNYGCEPGVSRQCSGGIWVEASAPGGCPISTRRAKRDVKYLDEAALARIADEAARLRLATYRYRDAALGGRTRLGFMLEDSPRSPASDLEALEVDLYSYASMTLALAQQQRRQLRALGAEVERLRRELARRAPRCR